LNPSIITTIGSGVYRNAPSMTVKFYLTSSAPNAPSETIGTVYDISLYNPDSNFEYYSEASCFNEGTKILSLNKQLLEEYIPIENLRSGDLIKTYKHGYRKIDLIGKKTMTNNPDKFQCSNCMYTIIKTDKNGLLEDLTVTGGHSILVDDLDEYKEKNDELFNGITPKIDDKYLLLAAVSNDFIKQENSNNYTYYHFTLENNENDDERFGVWANGILTETPSKNHFMKHGFILL
jgi:hypothetical protein